MSRISVPTPLSREESLYLDIARFDLNTRNIALFWEYTRNCIAYLEIRLPWDNSTPPAQPGPVLYRAARAVVDAYMTNSRQQLDYPRGPVLRPVPPDNVIDYAIDVCNNYQLQARAPVSTDPTDLVIEASAC